MKVLRECLPYEFMYCEYSYSRARSFSEVEVIEEKEFNWPGTHKNVINWYILSNGYAVGWNESPSRGWSFPVIKLK